MKTVDNPWTSLELKIARELFDNGASAQVIADNLPGRTRNSVIGMWHRQKWPARAPRGNDRKIKRYIKKNSTRNVKFPATPVKRKVIDIPIPVSLEVGILDLKPSTCRYATTPDDASVHLFCGNKSASPMGSWCEYHQALVHKG